MSTTHSNRSTVPPTATTLPVAKPRRKATNGSVRVNLTHYAGTSRFTHHPGEEFWYIELTLDYSTDIPGPQPAPALIARAKLLRVRCLHIEEIHVDLDQISADMGTTGFAVEVSSRGKLADYSMHVGAHSTFLVAIDVVVDPFWRGRRLGPALVAVASGLLDADITVLTPFGLKSRLDANGEVYNDYYLPRPGPDVQAKVKKAWRTAGFRPLYDGVVWQGHDIPEGHSFNKRIKAARDRLAKLDNQVDNAATRAWWWRRVDRQLRYAAKLAQTQ